MINDLDVVQWAYLLDPTVQLVNTAGKPLTDGYIEVYIAGTRNKYYCASDFDGTLHPFQIPLDSLGSNIILANPENAYDVYVYNRFGSLVMSRYNVTPADGGAVISNTERINELEELVVSAVTGLQGQIDDINEALDGKKDKQEEYSVTLTPTQTVSAIIQNENGEIEVIYQEIDLPEQVPNVDIVSPASTINITTHIDEETNTKTFSIDLSDLGHLEYGQYMATQDVYTGANMFRIKGNLETTQDGKIQLHKGNSYHITVRGYYTCGDLSNTSDTLNYIEYSTFTPMPVNVDNTVAGPQYFEISYDIFKLSADTNYYIAFAANAGKVSNLTVEIHSLSNLSILDPGALYQEGWGINIVSSVISVDPDIFNDYSTHTEVYDATVTAIQAATAAIPEIEQSDWAEDDPEAQSYIKNKPDLDVYATHDEVYESSVSSIQLVTGLIPDVSDFATHTEVYESVVTGVQLATSVIPDVSDFTTHSEVYEAVVTGVQLATSMIPEQLEAGQYISIEDNTINVTGLQPEGDYATNTEVHEATVTAIQVATGAIPDPLEAGQYVSIENNVITVTGLQEAGDYVTHDELTEAVTGIQQDLEGKKDKQESVEFEGSTTKTITKIIQNDNGVVSAVYEDIEMQNVLEAGQYVSIVNDVITVTGLQPEGDYATNTEVHNATVTAINLVTGLIPDAQVQSDWNQTNSAQPDYIKNKPNLNQYATDTEVSNAIVTAIEAVTAMIPAAQVQSDWTETNTADPSYIQNKPDEYNLVAGQNIGIFTAGDNVTIAASGAPTYTAGANIEINNDVISVTDVVQIDSRDEAPDGFIQLGNIIHWGHDDYGPGILVSAIMDDYMDNRPYVWYNTSDQGRENRFWGRYANDRETMSVSGESFLFIQEGDINYRRGDFAVTHEVPIIWSCSGMRYDIDRLQEAVTAIPDPQVQSDWNESNSSSKAYIKNKPNLNLYATDIEVSNAIATATNDMATKTWVGNQGYLTSVPSSYATDTEVSNAIATAIETVTAMIPDEQVQSNWNETNSSSKAYIQNKPSIPTVQLNGDNQVTAINNHEIAGTGGSTYTAGEYIDISNDVISVTGLDNSNIFWAIYNTTTYEDVLAAYNAGKKIFVKDDAVIAACSYRGGNPDAFQFNGINQMWRSGGPTFNYYKLSSRDGWYRQTGYTLQADWNQTNDYYASYIKNKPSIPVVELNSSDQVTAIDGHTIAGGGGGGTTYTAGDYISIDNDEISVTGIGNLVAGNNITITESGNDITISAQGGGGGSTYTAGDHISIDGDDVISVTGIGNLIAGNNITITESGNDITISAQGGSSTYTAGQYVSIDANNEISVTGLQVAGNYATTSDISDMATKTWVGNQGYLTAVPDTYATDIEVSQAIATATNDMATKTWVGNQGYLTAVPNTYATKVYVDGAVSGKQDKLTAGSNISISGSTIAVTGMPASPVQSDWNVTNSSSLAYIKNKPTIPSAPVQSNWNETNSSSLAYIQNKPTIPAAPVQSDWSVTNTSSLAYIKNKPSIWTPTVLHYDNATTLRTGSGQQIGSTGIYVKFNPGNFLTSYTISTCRMIAEQWTDTIWYVILSICIKDIIGSQWSYNADALTVSGGHIANGPALFNCFAEWNGSPWCQFTVDGNWDTSMKCINREIRNSSTADNNKLFINVEMEIHKA